MHPYTLLPPAHPYILLPFIFPYTSSPPHPCILLPYISLHPPPPPKLIPTSSAPTYAHPYPTHIPTCLYIHTYSDMHTHPHNPRHSYTHAHTHTHTHLSIPTQYFRVSNTPAQPSTVRAAEGICKLAGKVAHTYLEKKPCNSRIIRTPCF